MRDVPGDRGPDGGGRAADHQAQRLGAVRVRLGGDQLRAGRRTERRARRDQPGALVRRRAAERPRPVRPDRVRRAGVDHDLAVGDAADRDPRCRPRHAGGVLPRLGRPGDLAVDGLPDGVPGADLHDRDPVLAAGRQSPGPAGRGDQRVRLAVPGPGDPRSDDDAGEPGVRRGGAGVRGEGRAGRVPGDPAESARLGHRDDDAGDPGLHRHRGRPVVPRRRRLTADRVLGTDDRELGQLVLGGPDVLRDPGRLPVPHRAVPDSPGRQDPLGDRPGEAA